MHHLFEQQLKLSGCPLYFRWDIMNRGNTVFDIFSFIIKSYFLVQKLIRGKMHIQLTAYGNVKHSIWFSGDEGEGQSEYVRTYSC